MYAIYLVWWFYDSDFKLMWRLLTGKDRRRRRRTYRAHPTNGAVEAQEPTPEAR
jgi:hypothetical protein